MTAIDPPPALTAAESAANAAACDTVAALPNVPFRLVRLPANQVWAFVWGGQVIDIGRDHQRLFPARTDAVATARACGLTVDSRNGVHADGPNPFDARTV